jgi:glycosyltransferase involved in cell wall biosynthesis
MTIIGGGMLPVPSDQTALPLPTVEDADRESGEQRPRFSILVPSFNSGRYIAATLDSVRKQHFASLEVIVMDGGSTDETARVVADFGDLRVRFFQEPDRGQLEALQKAAKLARGDILYWLNADDILMPGSLMTVDDAFARDPRLDLVFSDDFAFSEEQRLLVVGGLIKGLSYRDHALFYRQMYSECVFWRRERTRYLPDEDYDLRVATDYAFFLNLRRGLRERWLPKRLGAFRITPNQMSERARALIATEQPRIRRQAHGHSGWSERSIRWRTVLHAPSFYLRQVLRPKVHAAARKMGRILDRDRRRLAMTEAFFEAWLVTGGNAVPELEEILYR